MGIRNYMGCYLIFIFCVTSVPATWITPTYSPQNDLSLSLPSEASSSPHFSAETKSITSNNLSWSLPIEINGNNWSQCEAVRGRGTIEDPYILANLIINASGHHGITIENSQAYGIIQNCTIFSGKHGINILFSENCELLDNIISENDYSGIYLFYSPRNSLIGNFIYDNLGIGINVESSASIAFHDNVVEKNKVHQISLTESPYCILSNNQVGRNYTYGISLFSSWHCVLTGNIALRNIYGLYFYESSNSSVENNTCDSNSRSGIYLYGSTECTLKSNSVDENVRGIYLRNSTTCQISHNIIHDNSRYGIHLSKFSDKNDISNNSLIKNGQMAIKNEGMGNILLDNTVINHMSGSFITSRITIVGKRIHFSDKTIGGTSPKFYLWDFGNGDLSSDQNSTCIYKKSGNYTVILTIIDKDGDVIKIEKEIHLQPSLDHIIIPTLIVTIGSMGAVVVHLIIRRKKFLDNCVKDMTSDGKKILWIMKSKKKQK